MSLPARTTRRVALGGAAAVILVEAGIAATTASWFHLALGLLVGGAVAAALMYGDRSRVR